jgi:flagellar basal body-associated protein FliL
MANKAEQLGNPGAQAAKIANIVMTVIGVIFFIGYIVIFAMAASSGTTRIR